MLPVVLYNGRRRWTAPVEMADLVQTGSERLAPYQPSQRYYLLDAARTADADLPSGNLVSALVGLERARGTARLPAPLQVQVLIDLLRAQPDEELRQAFAAWLRQGLRLAGRLPEGRGDALAQLQEMHTMLEENVRERTREWLEKGIEQGRAGHRPSSPPPRRSSTTPRPDASSTSWTTCSGSAPGTPCASSSATGASRGTSSPASSSTARPTTDTERANCTPDAC